MKIFSQTSLETNIYWQSPVMYGIENLVCIYSSILNKRRGWKRTIPLPLEFSFNAAVLAYKAQIFIHSNVPVICFIHRNYQIVADLLLFSVTPPHLLYQLMREFWEAIMLLLALDLCLSPAYLCSVVSWVKTLILSLVCYIWSCLIPFTCHRELCIDMLFPLLRCFTQFSSLCSHDPHIFSPNERVYKEVCACDCLNSAN